MIIQAKYSQRNKKKKSLGISIDMESTKMKLTLDELKTVYSAHHL